MPSLTVALAFRTLSPFSNLSIAVDSEMMLHRLNLGANALPIELRFSSCLQAILELTRECHDPQFSCVSLKGAIRSALAVMCSLRPESSTNSSSLGVAAVLPSPSCLRWPPTHSPTLISPYVSPGSPWRGFPDFSTRSILHESIPSRTALLASVAIV